MEKKVAMMKQAQTLVGHCLGLGILYIYQSYIYTNVISLYLGYNHHLELRLWQWGQGEKGRPCT